ncbi:uncharacterized protein KGF55_002045 [Candida pseudojiufengensis]|uniref:uncharacterized protein n=1 Tax=Candida pseudojiufengensis TaxID=497109 RepID=UPI002225A3D5|nr:uncharacterized protein KGF55_002045 [Candida pseudojiufengensis]KAI5964103.1 hypothetical protein KGF55_002045 [Candida pseudojiufengensis]
MSQEISLSLEETNKLRLELGLKPIPNNSEENLRREQPASSSENVIELSIEETNRLRESIGLKPIPIQNHRSVTPSDRLKSASHNEEEISKRISKAKVTLNKRKLMEIQSDEEELNTDDWLNSLGEEQSSKKQKIETIAKKHNDTNQVNAAIKYNLKELKTLKDNDILTLKDSSIFEDEDDDDILSNDKLDQASKVKKRLKEKKAADMLKFNGRRYISDEEEEENKLEPITSITNSKINIRDNDNGNDDKASKPNNVAVFTDLFEDQKQNKLSSSTSQSEPIKFKKFKKKKPLDHNKSRSRIRTDELNQLEEIDLNFEDLENELHQSLTVNRATKQRKQPKKKENTSSLNNDHGKLNEESNLNGSDTKRHYYTDDIYDDTIGFLNNLDTTVLDNQIGEEVKDILHNNDDKINEKNEPSEIPKNQDNNHKEIPKSQDDTHTTNVSAISTTTYFAPTNDEEQNEPNFGGSLADTLKFLKSQSDPNVNDSASNNSKTMEKLSQKSELTKLKIDIEGRILKEELLKDKNYKNLSKVDKDKYYENKLDERLKNKGLTMDEEEERSLRNGRFKKSKKFNQNNKSINEFDSYNPKVELKYKDDEGKDLNTKQAYKHLSHKYHGNKHKN